MGVGDAFQNGPVKMALLMAHGRPEGRIPKNI